MSVPAAGRRDRLREMLADLRMPGALEAVDQVLADVDGGAATAAEAIERLLAAQIALRNDRRLETAMRASRLPAVKTLAEFDFAFQPSIKREQIESLHELGFLGRRENVVLLGPPGVGKTHLAVSLAMAAAQSGRRVYYGTLAGLIESLEHAKASGQLARRLRGTSAGGMAAPSLCSASNSAANSKPLSTCTARMWSHAVASRRNALAMCAVALEHTLVYCRSVSGHTAPNSLKVLPSMCVVMWSNCTPTCLSHGFAATRPSQNVHGAHALPPPPVADTRHCRLAHRVLRPALRQQRRDPRLPRQRHLPPDRQRSPGLGHCPPPATMRTRAAAPRNQSLHALPTQPPLALAVGTPPHPQRRQPLRQRDVHALPVNGLQLPQPPAAPLGRPSHPPGTSGTAPRPVRRSASFGLLCSRQHQAAESSSPRDSPLGSTLSRRW